MHVLRARAVDDFILFDQLLLHALGGLDERAAFTRDVLVKVSVSVSAWPLLKACVQRVRTGRARHELPSRCAAPEAHGARAE